MCIFTNGAFSPIQNQSVFTEFTDRKTTEDLTKFNCLIESIKRNYNFASHFHLDKEFLSNCYCEIGENINLVKLYTPVNL